jgi:predicted nuclease of predicted toxin-antitoxin system
VKLLFDANLSPRLVKALLVEFPGSDHVRNVGLGAAADADIWGHARLNQFGIVSKDTDFRERSFVEGSPPKVIWLDVGNAGTEAIADLLRREKSRVDQFELQAEASLLILSLGPGAV